MMRIFILLLCSLAAVCSSCRDKNKIPEGILKPDKMQAVMWDVVRADIFTRDFIIKDTAKNATEENLKLQQEIFAIHHISKEDFYKSYNYYNLNTGLMKAVMDSMINKAEKKKEKTKPWEVQ